MPLRVRFGSIPRSSGRLEFDVFADEADRGLGRLSWAESGPKRIASAKTEVRAKAAISLLAQYWLHRPQRKTCRPRIAGKVGGRRDEDGETQPAGTFVATLADRFALRNYHAPPAATSAAASGANPKPPFASAAGVTVPLSSRARGLRLHRKDPAREGANVNEPAHHSVQPALRRPSNMCS